MSDFTPNLDPFTSANNFLGAALAPMKSEVAWFLRFESPPPRINARHKVMSMAYQLVLYARQNNQSIPDLFDAFRRVIEAGNDRGIWTLCSPVAPVLIKRDASGFSPDAFALLPEFRAIRLCIMDALPKFNHMKPDDQAGLFLYSITFNGGLVTKSVLKAFQQIAGERLLRLGPLSFLDLPLGSSELDNTHRWFLPHQCALLYLNLHADAVHLLRTRSLSDLNNLAQRCLSRHVLYQHHLPTHIGSLLNVAQSGLSLEMCGLVRESMINPTRSTSLPQPVLLRLFGKRTPTNQTNLESTEQDPVPEFKDLIDEPDPIYETRQKDPWLDQIYASLRSGQQPDVARKLRAIRDSEDNPPLIARLIAGWLSNRLTGKSIRPIKVNTAYGLMTTVGKRIYGLAGGSDITQLSLDEYEVFYTELLECAVSNNNAQTLKKGSRNFQNFLAHNHSAPAARDINTLKGDIDSTQVDANLLSFDEYEAVLADIQRQAWSNEAIETTSILVILAFKGGFRRNELIKLRTIDLTGDVRPEVIIRPFMGRQLKTSNARRRVPIHALLNDSELKRVLAWRDNRFDTMKTGDSSPYLFRLSGSSRDFVEQEAIITKIQAIARQVTGDSGIKFHHFRHSFASWLLLGLTHADRPLAVFNHLPITHEWLQKAHHLRQRLYELPVNSSFAIRRPHAYLIASLLGHSNPDITLRHYTHWVDLMVIGALQASHATMKVKALSPLLQVHRQTVEAHRRNHTLEVLVDRLHQKSELGSPLLSSRAINNGQQGQNDTEPLSLFHRINLAWGILYQSGVENVPTDILVDRFGIGVEQTTLLIERAHTLALMESKPGHYRHSMIPRTEASETPKPVACPCKLRKKQERETAQTVCNYLEDADQDETLWAINYYINNIGRTKNDLAFRDFGIGSRFLKWLLSIGVPWSGLRLKLFTGTLPVGKAKQTTKTWRQELTLPRRITLKQSQHVKRSLGPHGWFVIHINEFTTDRGSEGNYGIRFVMMMAWIIQPISLVSDAELMTVDETGYTTEEAIIQWDEMTQLSLF